MINIGDTVRYRNSKRKRIAGKVLDLFDGKAAIKQSTEVSQTTIVPVSYLKLIKAKKMRGQLNEQK